MIEQLLTVWYQHLHSWTYLSIGALLTLASFLLLIPRLAKFSRTPFQIFTLAILCGWLGNFIPWLARSISFTPTPIDAFTRAIVFPVFYGQPALAMLLMLAVIIGTTVLAGRTFCGWICPVGALQSLMGKWRGERRKRVSARTAHVTRIMLILTFGGVLIFAKRITYDYLNPYPLLLNNRPLSLSIVIPTLTVGLASIWIHRPFCSLICPVGQLAWLAERVSFIKMRLNSSCNKCGECLSSCSCEHLSRLVEGKGNLTECHACGSCLGTCSRNAIRYRWPFQRGAAATIALKAQGAASGK